MHLAASLLKFLTATRGGKLSCCWEGKGGDEVFLRPVDKKIAPDSREVTAVGALIPAAGDVCLAGGRAGGQCDACPASTGSLPPRGQKMLKHGLDCANDLVTHSFIC